MSANVNISVGNDAEVSIATTSGSGRILVVYTPNLATPGVRWSRTLSVVDAYLIGGLLRLAAADALGKDPVPCGAEGKDR